MSPGVSSANSRTSGSGREPGRSGSRSFVKYGFASPVLATAPDRAHAGEEPGDNGFPAAVEEGAYQDGWHRTEDVSYLVVRRGEHRPRDGTRVEANELSATNAWRSVNFKDAFGAAPIVFAQVASKSFRTPLVHRLRRITPTGFDVRL